MLAALTLAGGCDNKGGHRLPTATASASAKGSDAAMPSTVASSTRMSPSKYAGRWEGTYRTTTVSVSVPAGIRYPAWQKDDAQVRVGNGNIHFRVADSGLITGTGEGILGKQTITGRLDDDGLSAALTPLPDAAEGGMTGVLVGPLGGDKIVAQLHVSDTTGDVVREAKVTLTRAAVE